MAGFFALIQLGIYGFIIYVVLHKVKQKGNGSSYRSSDTTNGSYTPPTRTGVPTTTTTTLGSSTTAKTSAPFVSHSQTQAKAQSESDSFAWPDEETDEGSVTDYLAEKARQDQISHAEEKREENRRLDVKSGGRQAAERLYEGDLVPNGKHCVVCAYCAANNLIPNGSRIRYSCYFCREPL